MEKSLFLGDWGFFMWFLVILLVGTGEPPPYCNKNTLGKIESKFGIGRPPPWVGTKDQIFPMIRFEGSPNAIRNMLSVSIVQSINLFVHIKLPTPKHHRNVTLECQIKHIVCSNIFNDHCYTSPQLSKAISHKGAGLGWWWLAGKVTEEMSNISQLSIPPTPQIHEMGNYRVSQKKWVLEICDRFLMGGGAVSAKLQR